MAERHSCPVCGHDFGSQRESDDHGMKAHGGVAAKKGGEPGKGEEKKEPEKPA